MRAPIENPLSKSTAVFIEPELPVLQELAQKLSEWVMIPDSHAEPFVLRRYRPGQSMDVHHDFVDSEGQYGTLLYSASQTN